MKKFQRNSFFAEPRMNGLRPSLYEDLTATAEKRKQKFVKTKYVDPTYNISILRSVRSRNRPSSGLEKSVLGLVEADHCRGLDRLGIF